MSLDSPRLSICLLLAAFLHLTAVWGWSKWGGGSDESVHLPRLDMSRVELSLADDDDAISPPPASPQARAPESVREVVSPPPLASSLAVPANNADLPSSPPPMPAFTPAALTVPPPSEAPPPERSETTADKTFLATAANAAESAKVDVPPRPVSKLQPQYPRACRRRGEEGLVALDIEVDVWGKAVKVSVALSSGFPQLDAAAVAAVRNAGFTPAVAGGKKVPGRIRLPFSFQLKNN